MVKVLEMLIGKEPDGWKPNSRQLYISASYSGWTRQGIHDLIGYHFKKQSTKELTFSEYNQVLRWIEDLEPNTVTTERDKNTEDLF
jgi:hypothetical protein